MATETPATTESGKDPATTTDDHETGYLQPEIDLAALSSLLDGDYADVRELVRKNLVENADVLEAAETLGHDEFRDRVRDVVVSVAGTGQTALGFPKAQRSEEHTSELQSLMRISYAVFCLQKKTLPTTE